MCVCVCVCVCVFVCFRVNVTDINNLARDYTSRYIDA